MARFLSPQAEPTESPPTTGQRRTQAARDAFASTFASPEEKSAHYRDLARRSNAGRLTLSAEDAVALADAFELLSRIAQRGKIAAAQTDPKAA
jgi:hypothetical protein